MRDLRCADAESVGAKSPMRRGVAVAADDQKAWKRQSLLGTNHMHNTLARIAQAEQRDAGFRRVGFEIAHHRRYFGIGDLLATPTRRHVVIGDAESESGLGNRTAARFHLAEGVE